MKGFADAVIERERELGEETVWSNGNQFSLGDVYQFHPALDELLKGDLGDALRGCFRTDFKIFYTTCYRSLPKDTPPSASQLWHADGGPGTCINVLIYLTDTSAESGAMECLDWETSYAIFEKERRLRRKTGHPDTRDERAAFYEQEIHTNFADKVMQPIGEAGLILLFRNNCIHRGGYALSGHHRRAIVLHIYPSDVAPQFEHYRDNGTAKVAANPTDPAF